MALSSWDNNGLIIDKLSDFFINCKGPVKVEFNLIYVDSTSRKVFYEIFKKLQQVSQLNPDSIEIYWIYDTEDESIYDLGVVLSEVIAKPLHFVEEQ